MSGAHGRPVTGRDNLEIFGLDINVPVFVVSGVTILAFIMGVLLFQERAAETLGATRVWITTQFDWLFLSTGNICILSCLFLIFSPLGRVRIGGRDASPDYSRLTWFAMIFAAVEMHS